ncbi:nicotinate phosphoribosyltransferase [Quadrisphaera sp. DSM 44207]|uniref:nicotinate phosphoribosyltransferase n=1 Tax=Quadrisphaera sp. DSM 44207 TaxID=1881057 RepID=UPI000890668E|nr:nicotinate phosphoribosyltransferase [Quadrisphaera sp. DSM 44207]SDQ07518.1 nicotinate phosphoribosyltransferase [Quadrisphaera sp. DSM 44207]
MQTSPLPSTALLTDHYELTMLRSALRSGAAARRCTFEVFARRLPHGRRYGVVAGTGRLLEAIARFRFDEPVLARLREAGTVDEATLEHLASWRFTGDVDGYAEGEVFFPGSPVLTVTAPFGEAVLLETLVLSVLNHDSAVAAAAARMVSASSGRPLIEMGTRRTHEEAAVAAARAAFLAGFSATSNLEAGRRHGLPTTGTSAHAFTLLHETEEEAFAAQVAALGTGTTLLVDTYDIRRGITTAVQVAGTGLGAVRIDSGDLAVLAHQAREQLDSLGATSTRIVLSGDLDEHALAALVAAPVDAYGVGTSVVLGSGAPTAGMVYKLVDVEGRHVAKRSESKTTHGGRKVAVRRHRASGTATEEVVSADGAPPAEPGDRALQVPLVRGGEPVPGLAALEDSRRHLREVMVTLPWEGLALSRGEPAIPTRQLPPR